MQKKYFSSRHKKKIDTQFKWLPVEESGEWKWSMWIKYNEKQKKKKKVNMLKHNICKWCDWQGIRLQNLQTAHKPLTASKWITQSKNGQKT